MRPRRVDGSALEISGTIAEPGGSNETQPIHRDETRLVVPHDKKAMGGSEMTFNDNDAAQGEAPKSPSLQYMCIEVHGPVGDEFRGGRLLRRLRRRKVRERVGGGCLVAIEFPIAYEAHPGPASAVRRPGLGDPFLRGSKESASKETLSDRARPGPWAAWPPTPSRVGP